MQMTGKLLRNVLKCLLPCLVISLTNPDETEKLKFREVLTCVRYFVDFALVCRYKRHTENSIRYLDEYLAGFHRYKQVFERFKGGKRTVSKQ